MTDTQPVVVFKKRGKTTNLKKRPATPPSDSGSEYSSEDESGTRVKRRKKAGITTTTSSLHRRPQDLSKSTQYTGDRSSNITQLDDATKSSNWTPLDRASDPSKPPTSTQQQQQKGPSGPSSSALSSSTTYKGKAAYDNFLQKNPDKLSSSSTVVGPVRAAPNTNIRTITVTDFAPDVCKDYKTTGFCGFGDSCKFLHAREDYKQGWQLDKEWEKVTKGKKKQSGTVVGSAANRGDVGADEDDDDDDADAEEEAKLEGIPFACILCREAYKQPVVTKCGHYFCEACALKRHKTKAGKTCAACGTDTGGTFSVAKNLRKLLEKKRERIRRRKEKAREAGEEVSSDEEV